MMGEVLFLSCCWQSVRLTCAGVPGTNQKTLAERAGITDTMIGQSERGN